MKYTIKELKRINKAIKDNKIAIENMTSESYSRIANERETATEIKNTNLNLNFWLSEKHQILKKLEFELSQELNKTETEQIELKKIIN